MKRRASVGGSEATEQDVRGELSTVTLGEVADIVMGQSPPGNTVSAENGLALLNGPTEFGAHHPIPVQFTTDIRKRAQPGDLLFCVRGSTTGRMNWADQEYAIGRGIAAIRHHQEPALQPLIRGVIELELPKLLAQATGSTFPNVSAHQLAEIPYPSLDKDEQRAIAQILGTLDDKTELNRQLNETLEELVRAIFKDWFVDFGPVRAKLEGRDTGLPEQLAELFPDRLVESELGGIPEGWGVKALDEIAAFQNGLALQKYRPQGDEEWLPVVKIADLKRGRAKGDEKATANIRPECIIDDGDVVFSWSGSLTVKIWCGGCAALNQHLFKVTSTKFPKWFFLHCIHSHLRDFQDIAAGKATTMGHIKRHHLSEARCAVPDGQLLTAVDSLLAVLLERGIAASIESRILAALRDTLLPKLVSGEVRVDNSKSMQE